MRAVLWFALIPFCALPAAAQQAAEPAPHPPGRVPPPGRYLPGFDALHYDIALTLPESGDRIEGTTTIRIAVEPDRPDTLRLDLVGLLVTSVRVGANTADPAKVAFHQEDGRVYVALPASVRGGD